MGVPAPLRAGPAPRMELHEESISEAKLPMVDIDGDADSLRMLENYQDDYFASFERKKSPPRSRFVSMRMKSIFAQP